MSDKAHLRLILDVTYDLNGEGIKAMKDRLAYISQQAYGEGLFTGVSEAEVDKYKFEIEEVQNA